jgi:hypothetical protein
MTALRPLLKDITSFGQDVLSEIIVLTLLLQFYICAEIRLTLKHFHALSCLNSLLFAVKQ